MLLMAQSTSSSTAYIIFASANKGTQARAGFDGWVRLLRDEFDTEDQAWPQEKLRLAAIARKKLDTLRAAGVQVDALEITFAVNLLLEAPDFDVEDERLWCIEFFPERMYDYVVSDAQLLQRLRKLQEDILGREQGVVVPSSQVATPSGSRAGALGVIVASSSDAGGGGSGTGSFG